MLLAMIWCLLFGAFIGWAASVAMRTPTSQGILIDIACGAVGAVALSLMLQVNTRVDSLAAGFLGAIAALALLTAARRLRLASPPRTFKRDRRGQK